MNNRTKSLIFDFIQAASILSIFLTGPILTSNSFFILFQLLAILILLESIWEMKTTKFYRVPDVGKQKRMVTSGIYKYIRNPMYLSQLLFLGTLVANYFTIYRLVIYLIFLVNFIFKIQYEEILLATYFKEFEKYKKTSWKLIPFIY